MQKKIKIIQAKNIGFCSGVKRAILITEEAIKKEKKPIQVLGSLVHNENVVNEFKKKKVKFVKNLKGAKPGTLLIQAHGVAPFSLKNKRITLKDATCPLVKKVQTIAESLFKNGYQVIIIGDKNHSETKGIRGYTKNKAIVIENEEQAQKLKKIKKIGVVCQTTQNSEKVNKIIKILRKKTKNIKFINTLCPEVQNRQKELQQFLRKSEGVLVIGSKKSANSKRLVSIAANRKKRVWLINSPKDLKKNDFYNIQSLAVVSGTSTPDAVIREIIKKLK